VSSGARPWVQFSFFNDIGADWIAFHISDCFPEMVFIEDAGIESSLPEVSREVVLLVKVQSIQTVSITQSIG
jgi:hypothetical protein